MIENADTVDVTLAYVDCKKTQLLLMLLLPVMMLCCPRSWYFIYKFLWGMWSSIKTQKLNDDAHEFETRNMLGIHEFGTLTEDKFIFVMNVNSSSTRPGCFKVHNQVEHKQVSDMGVISVSLFTNTNVMSNNTHNYYMGFKEWQQSQILGHFEGN